MLFNAWKYQSCFGGLWTDMANAHEEVKAKLTAGLISHEEAKLLDFRIDRYVIIKGPVPHDVTDRIIEDIEQAWKRLDSSVKVADDSYGRASLKQCKRNEPGILFSKIEIRFTLSDTHK